MYSIIINVLFSDSSYCMDDLDASLSLLARSILIHYLFSHGWSWPKFVYYRQVIFYECIVLARLILMRAYFCLYGWPCCKFIYVHMVDLVARLFLQHGWSSQQGQNEVFCVRSHWDSSCVLFILCVSAYLRSTAKDGIGSWMAEGTSPLSWLDRYDRGCVHSAGAQVCTIVSSTPFLP